MSRNEQTNDPINTPPEEDSQNWQEEVIDPILLQQATAISNDHTYFSEIFNNLTIHSENFHSLEHYAPNIGYNRIPDHPTTARGHHLDFPSTTARRHRGELPSTTMHRGIDPDQLIAALQNVARTRDNGAARSRDNGASRSRDNGASGSRDNDDTRRRENRAARRRNNGAERNRDIGASGSRDNDDTRRRENRAARSRNNGAERNRNNGASGSRVISDTRRRENRAARSRNNGTERNRDIGAVGGCDYGATGVRDNGATRARDNGASRSPANGANGGYSDYADVDFFTIADSYYSDSINPYLDFDNEDFENYDLDYFNSPNNSHAYELLCEPHSIPVHLCSVCGVDEDSVLFSNYLHVEEETIGAKYVSKNDEFREVRSRQDEEYSKSLAADNKKKQDKKDKRIKEAKLKHSKENARSHLPEVIKNGYISLNLCVYVRDEMISECIQSYNNHIHTY